MRDFWSEGYAASVPPPSSLRPIGKGVLSVWYVNFADRGPYPPGKETNIAFILRSGPGEFPKEKDDELCFSHE